jgi:RHS repeat-associated protein
MDYTTTYNGLGLPIKSTGPFKGGDGVTISSTYDADFVGGKVKPWLGLRAQVFSRHDYAGDPRLQFWESSVNRGGLSYVWRDRDEEWSGQATGIWTPELAIDKRGSEKGWTFRFDSSRAGAARLIVDSTPCIADSSQTCVIRDLPVGPKSVTIELPRAGAVGYFAVNAAAGSDALAPVSFDSVVPGYATPTTTQINDVIPGEMRPISVTKHDNPASGEVSAHIIPGGLRTSYTYEGLNDEQDRWGRNLTRTTPGGEVQTMSYWPSTGTTTLPAVCGAATVALLGLPKSTQRQDGTSMQNFYDGRGRAVASVTRDARGEVVQTACVDYRDDDSVAASTLYNSDGVVIDRSITNDAVEGNPLVSSTVVTHGPAAPVAKGQSFTTTVTLDLLGRPVRTEDSTGLVTTMTYNSLNSVVREESTAPGGARLVRVNGYRADDGKLASVTINGQRAATIGFDDRTGRPESVTYPNGISTTMSYFGNGSVDRVSSSAAGSEYLSKATLSEFGRVLANELSVAGAQNYSESRSYIYDEAGRLVSAQIGSAGAKAISYEYGFGNQDSSCGSGYAKAGDDALRTSGSRNGVDYITCYDARGRVASTTDPLVTGDPTGVDSATMTHDGLGRLVKIGGVARPVEFTYGVAGELARMSEGPADSRVITTFNSFFGEIVSKTVDSVAGSHSVTYAGPFLINDGRLVATQYALPGGANVTINVGETAALTLAGVDGAAIATVEVPALGAGGKADVGLADRFGPFGEPLITPSAAPDSAVPQYSWQSAERHETLPGTSSVTIFGTRAYLPAFGMFLSTDPQPESGSNLYSYTMGDPINSHDKTGNEAADAVIPGALGVVGFAFSVLVGRFWRGAWGAAAGIALSAGVGVAGYIAAASCGLDTTSSILVGLGAGLSSLGVFALSRWRLTKSFDYPAELMMARNEVGRNMVSFEKELSKMSKVQRISDPRFIARMGLRANRNLAKKADAFTKVSGARTRIAVISDRSFLPIRTKVVRREIGGRLDQIIEEAEDLFSSVSNSLPNSSSL